jgi:hypothetical protein
MTITTITGHAALQTEVQQALQQLQRQHLHPQQQKVQKQGIDFFRIFEVINY